MGPGILPETTVGKHNLPCHLQIPTKALSCKKEAICRVLRAKKEGDLLESAEPASKASISDGMVVCKCIRYGQLACFGMHYER